MAEKTLAEKRISLRRDLENRYKIAPLTKKERALKEGQLARLKAVRAAKAAVFAPALAMGRALIEACPTVGKPLEGALGGIDEACDAVLDEVSKGAKQKK